MTMIRPTNTEMQKNPKKLKIDGFKLALRISPLYKQIIHLVSRCQLRLSSASGLFLMGIPSVLFLALPPCPPPQRVLRLF